MIGLLLAFLYLCGVLIFGQAAFPEAFLDAATFLFFWYLVWAILAGVLLVLVNLGVAVGGAALGKRWGALGAMVGSALGGTLSLTFTGKFIFRRLAFLGGAYLLKAGVAEGGALWDTPRLVLGAMLILVALATRKEPVFNRPNKMHAAESREEEHSERETLDS